MYNIAVHFDVQPEHREDFIAAALEDGRNSDADEPGTRRFEFIVDEDNPNRFFALCGCPHRANYADAVTMPTRSSGGPGGTGVGGLLGLAGGRGVGIVAAPDEVGSGDFTDATVAPWDLLQPQQRRSRVERSCFARKGR